MNTSDLLQSKWSPKIECISLNSGAKDIGSMFKQTFWFTFDLSACWPVSLLTCRRVNLSTCPQYKWINRLLIQNQPVCVSTFLQYRSVYRVMLLIHIYWLVDPVGLSTCPQYKWINELFIQNRRVSMSTCWLVDLSACPQYKWINWLLIQNRPVGVWTCRCVDLSTIRVN